MLSQVSLLNKILFALVICVLYLEMELCMVKDLFVQCRMYSYFSNGVFASADAAYVLAYSVIMLTTDLHSSQVSPGGFVATQRAERMLEIVLPSTGCAD